MSIEALEALLESHSNERFVDEQLFGKPPWIFGSGIDYDAWLRGIANTLGLKKADIRIVGSGATGYSLSPLKPGRPFRQSNDERGPSDIDVAIVDKEQFEHAWDVLVAAERARNLRIRTDMTKIKQDIYWGVISNSTVPFNTDIGRRLLETRIALTMSLPVRGHKVKFRVYRRQDDLRSYHISSLRQLRSELRKIREDNNHGK